MFAIICVYVINKQACDNFFVKKPKMFENVKSERGVANFQKSQTPRASTKFKKNLRFRALHMFAGLIIAMSMTQHHFCLIIMNQKLMKF